MLYTQIEHHTVILTKTMEIDNQDILDAGITVEQLEQYMNDPELTGDNPVSDEVHDIAHELITSYSEERNLEEQWWSDDKGCTEIQYQLEE